MSSITKALFDTLSAYLISNVSGLTAVYDDFPAPNQVLSYPCASICLRSPTFVNGMPYVVAKTEGVDEDDAPNGIWTVRRCNGRYEIKMQLDVWSSSKFARHELQEAFLAALNPTYAANGLNLTLSGYFSEVAHVFTTGFEFMNDQGSSQRNEWRVRLALVADVKSLLESVEPLMTSFENTVEVSESVEIPEPVATQDEPII